MKYTIEQLKTEAQEDLNWTIVNAAEKGLRIPSIKTKYCAILYELEIEVAGAEMAKNAVYKTLHEQYIGGQKTQVLIDRRDLPLYIHGDKEYIKVVAIYELYKGMAKFVEGVLKGIDSASFSINSALKWEMYQNGG